MRTTRKRVHTITQENAFLMIAGSRWSRAIEWRRSRTRAPAHTIWFYTFLSVRPHACISAGISTSHFVRNRVVAKLNVRVCIVVIRSKRAGGMRHVCGGAGKLSAYVVFTRCLMIDACQALVYEVQQ